jgi:glycosyltransferase involved in cell wall biosynthesis
VLEAMASGLPVIATANGPADVVRHGVDGFIIPARDPDAIAQSLEAIYRDPERRAQMALEARARALEHTWTRSAARVADLVLE